MSGRVCTECTSAVSVMTDTIRSVTEISNVRCTDRYYIEYNTAGRHNHQTDSTDERRGKLLLLVHFELEHLNVFIMIIVMT